MATPVYNKTPHKVIGLTLSVMEGVHLKEETKKFNELVGTNITPQKFLIKLLYDHKKRNKNT